jgi:hypothetical protein
LLADGGKGGHGVPVETKANLNGLAAATTDREILARARKFIRSKKIDKSAHMN